MKNTGLQLYRKITGIFPEAASLPAGEGNLLKFGNTRELHLNVTESENGTSTILLNFYKDAQEEACYEIGLDHLQKTATPEIVRADTEQSLYSRLAQTERASSKAQSILSRSGRADINQTLFRNLQGLIPNFENVGTGKLEVDNRKLKPGRGGIEIYVLQNGPTEMTLEISPINIDGISRMTVALDKKNQTAGVVEISDSFGTYPSYLPYPDGQEMKPAEREEYSQILSGWVSQKFRVSGKSDANLPPH